MNLSTLEAQIALGEDSHRQFKRDVARADALAGEMAAFGSRLRHQAGVGKLGRDRFHR